ncbi:MAG: glutamine synthetase, partial [Gammaproteobacteria bacterium]|nr:glutamine synthetase [Gammaproteobacteria bacterium]
MDEPTINDWLDRHHVERIRTHATTLDSIDIGKYVNRPKFVGTLQNGHSISDMALAMDVSGSPHLTFWHDFRTAHLGDIHLKPDLDTLIWDGIDPNLGHCICEFVTTSGEEISLCPRTLLRRMTNEIATLGYEVKATFELEFFLYNNSFDSARRRGYRDLEPVTATTMQSIYHARNAYRAKPFMDEVIKRLEWQRLEWESWNDEGGLGQIELNFPPADPVTAADRLCRVRQLMYEVAVDLDMSVTFMAHPSPGYSSGLHIHHSLVDTDCNPAFVDDNGRTPLLLNWIGGVLETIRGSTSVLCPTINSYRRLSEFSAPPVTQTWGEENKSAALRVISHTKNAARIEHRLAASDANPYLALAFILAGGLAGLKHELEPPEELNILGWGLPDDYERLPRTILKAAEALDMDDYLKEIIGEDVVE